MSAKILIVEDKPEMLILLETLVRERTPYEAVLTNNPLEVAKLIQEENIDIVITEFKIPAQDGNGILETIQGMDRDIPVIIISDFGDVDTASEAMRRGAFDFIIKPFRQERILFSIANGLKLRMLNKENITLKKQLKILAFEAVPYSARNP